MSPLILAAAEPGIHSIDFKNFEYPWMESGTPSSWSWLEATPEPHVLLRSGHLTLDPTDPSHSAYLELLSIAYGDLDGDRRDEAAVALLYGSGGTAHWTGGC